MLALVDNNEARVSDLITRSHVSGGTFPDLFTAIDLQFGPITLDLAATAEDTVCADFISPEEDSLCTNWYKRIGHGTGYLNPPSGDLQLWANKIYVEAKLGGPRFLALLPLSLDAHWCWRLLDYATVYVLTPRVLYEGLPIPLAIFAFDSALDGKVWRWHWRTGLIE